MPRAIDLLRQGRHNEIWQMCCGYLKLDISQFMEIQNRLLLGQIELLSHSGIGKKIMGITYPTSVREFRDSVPLTNYSAYCPELVNKQEDFLPGRPSQWVHTSGRTGEYSCKWVPITPAFTEELSPILYGIGLLSASQKWGDLAPFVQRPNFIYSVAPRPYVSGALASILQDQTPSNCFPSIAEAESLSYEERISLGFNEALSEGLDYFFGLSMILAAVGDKFVQSANQMNIKNLLSRPKPLLRLSKGLLHSRMAKRGLLPKDIWHLRGIIASGLDSSIYKEKIKEYWGRYPLDIYANTEGSVIATQAWDYSGMTFIPNLNFLEFIPEKEHFKWQMDHKYQPKTVLLDEVTAGECYEIVFTNLHGGSLIRYRVGDMIRITSLENDNLNIKTPQMVFERRCDDLLDFVVVRVTEKTVWKAIEKTGVPYVDWVAFRNQGEPVLNIYLELAGGYQVNPEKLELDIYQQILKADDDSYMHSDAHDDLSDMIKFQLKLVLLSTGTFSGYIARRRAEGADLAHLKPQHVNPSQKTLAALLSKQTVAETGFKIPVATTSANTR